MEKAYFVLIKKFGYIDFLNIQKKAVEYTLENKDLLVIAKTSAGKSLCYQLPALCQIGLTVIISPLKSLINDQIDNLKKKNIECYTLYGDTLQSDKNLLYAKLLDNKDESIILYTTPETLEYNQDFSNILRKIYKKNKIKRFVFDEAHTISTWGHDFRPSYLKLDILRKNYKKVPITALTATATPEVKADIADILGLNNYEIITQSIIRNNLNIKIKKNSSNLQQKIVSLIKDNYLNQTGIIYCNSRKKCEEVNYVLKQNSLNSSFFHAGMDSDERTNIQSLWQKSKINIIVATIAFGMGIDKENVRYIIHYNLPKNIESYYQEIGRAGRDGKKSDCILFHNEKDICIYKSQINKNISETEDSKEKMYYNNQLNKLDQLELYLNNDIDCRQFILNHYFGLKENIKCNNCDNCLNPDKNYEKEDVTELSIKITQVLKTLGESANKTNIKKILYDKEKKKNFFLNGSCINISPILFDRTFVHLVTNNYIVENVKKKNDIWYNYLTLSNKAKTIDINKNKIELLSSKNKKTLEFFFNNKPEDKDKDFFVETKPYKNIT